MCARMCLLSVCASLGLESGVYVCVVCHCVCGLCQRTVGRAHAVFSVQLPDEALDLVFRFLDGAFFRFVLVCLPAFIPLLVQPEVWFAAQYVRAGGSWCVLANKPLLKPIRSFERGGAAR